MLASGLTSKLSLALGKVRCVYQLCNGWTKQNTPSTHHGKVGQLISKTEYIHIFLSNYPIYLISWFANSAIKVQIV